MNDQPIKKQTFLQGTAVLAMATVLVKLMGFLFKVPLNNIKEAMQGAAALMESYFEPKFNLLFENQQTMLETLAPKSRGDELEEEVSVLRSVVRQHSRDIELLKHA